jgi:hypothetical protein
MVTMKKLDNQFFFDFHHVSSLLNFNQLNYNIQSSVSHTGRGFGKNLVAKLLLIHKGAIPRACLAVNHL